MKLEVIKKRTNGIPHMTLADAEELATFIRKNQIRDILELGFCHGVSTCYFAGTLDDIGRGHITTIDLESARHNTPNVERLLEDLELKTYVTVFYEPTSYVWRLMMMLREQPIPQFDFCYVDGAHNWFTDGFAFLLVDKLLRPGGWIVFDDLDWTYASSPTLKDTPLVHAMPDAEKTTQQVRQVYELLVKPHPAYDSFLIKNGKAYARKAPEASTQEPPLVRQEVVYVQEHVGLGAVVSKIVRRLVRR